jgi:plastocyanin
MAVSRRLLALSAVALLVLGACGGDDTGGSDNSGATEDGAAEDGGDAASGGSSTLEVTATDFQFSPTELSVEPDSEVTLTFSNEGQAPHTFTAEDLDVDVHLDPGASEEITFTAPPNGSIEWVCTIHPSMTGTIAVGGGSSDDTSKNGGGGSAPDDYSY